MAMAYSYTSRCKLIILVTQATLLTIPLTRVIPHPKITVISVLSLVDSTKANSKTIASMAMGCSTSQVISTLANSLTTSLKISMASFCGRMVIYIWEALSTA